LRPGSDLLPLGWGAPVESVEIQDHMAALLLETAPEQTCGQHTCLGGRRPTYSPAGFAERGAKTRVRPRSLSAGEDDGSQGRCSDICEELAQLFGANSLHLRWRCCDSTTATDADWAE